MSADVSPDRWEIDRPVFVIGTGRCGSTIVFEALTLHEHLGWLSNYNERFPTLEIASLAPRVYSLPLDLPRGEKPQFRQGRTPLNKLLPKPSECYPKWQVMCGRKFRYHYLLGVEATPQERRRTRRAVAWLQTLQAKPRFAAKITGPARIGYLRSIFPDARFLHVIRDGRAVVNSWLNVGFWKEGGGYHTPRWQGGLPEGWEEEWARYDRHPAALAALQYRAIIERSRQERSELLEEDQYLEIAYESFVANPIETTGTVLGFMDLPPSPRVDAYVGHPGRYRSMNTKYLEAFSKDELAMLDAILAGVGPPP